MSLADECPEKLSEEAHADLMHVIGVRRGGLTCVPRAVAEKLVNTGRFRVSKAQYAQNTTVPEAPALELPVREEPLDPA